MDKQFNFNVLDTTTDLALHDLRDLLDSELMLIGGGDVIQFGG